MPKPSIPRDLAYWSGGRNSTFSRDRLDPSELVDTTNVRIGEQYGALTKRPGSQRLHSAAIGAGAAVTGLFQWDWSGGKQLVALSAGNLYHKLVAAANFTAVVPASLFSTTTPQTFASFRAVTAGAPLVLYIADGKVQKFDGAAVTRIDGTNFVPAADLLASYHTRMFYRDTTLQKHAFWSKVGNAENCTTGTPTDGGSAMVDVLHGDALVTYEVVGSSLLIATKNSIARYTGYSNDDIRIAQDTEGVSPDVGIVGVLAKTRADTVVSFISAKGPYIATEAGVTPIGVKIEADFAALDKTVLAKAVVEFHEGRKELWCAVAGAGDGGLNKTVYIYSLRLQCWYGPFTYPFGITCMARYEDATGYKTIVAGSTDGFVRNLDVPSLTKDDVLSNGTGGSTYSARIEFPADLVGRPKTRKLLEALSLQINLRTGDSLDLVSTWDKKAAVPGKVTKTLAGSAADGTTLTDVYQTVSSQGKRHVLVITDSTPTANPFTISALSFSYLDLLRT